MPKSQVMMLQTTRLIKPDKTTIEVMDFGSTTPSPIVFATANPKRNGARKWAKALKANAFLGPIAREDMTVATTFPESWKPLRKAEKEARAIKAIKGAILLFL